MPYVAAITAIVGTVVSVGTTAYQLSKGTPDPIKPDPLTPPANPPPTTLPVAAPDKSLDTAEQESRAAGARKQRELQQRRSGASSILSSPLGVTSVSPSQPTSVLGR